MTNSSLGEEGGAALKAVFETCPALHTIRLEDCELGEEGCLVVADALGSLSKLREIDLRNNDMEADSAEALGKSLDGKTSIEAVKLDEDLEEGADPVRSAPRRWARRLRWCSATTTTTTTTTTQRCRAEAMTMRAAMPQMVRTRVATRPKSSPQAPSSGFSFGLAGGAASPAAPAPAPAAGGGFSFGSAGGAASPAAPAPAPAGRGSFSFGSAGGAGRRAAAPAAGGGFSFGGGARCLRAKAVRQRRWSRPQPLVGSVAVVRARRPSAAVVAVRDALRRQMAPCRRGAASRAASDVMAPDGFSFVTPVRCVWRCCAGAVW